MGYFSRSLWSGLGLAAVAAGVGAYAYFGTYRGGLETERRRIEATKLFDVDPAEVSGGEVTAKGATVRFGRSTQGWMIQHPIETLADRYAIQQLLVETLFATSEASVDPGGSPESLAKYGLEPAQVQVVLDLRNGQKAELRVGNKSEFDGRYYAQNPALPTLGLVDQRVLRGVDRDLYALRDKRFSLFDAGQVRSIECRRGDRVLYRLERRPDQGWNVVAQPPVLADPFEVVRFLESIRDLRAKSFVDDSGSEDPALLGRYGLEAPTYVLRLDLAEGDPLVLRFGVARDADGISKHFGRADGGSAIGEVPDLFFKRLDRPATDFHDRRVLDLDPSRVAKISIERGGSALELRQTRGDSGDALWELAGAPAVRAPEWRVSSLLYALASLKAEQVDTHDPGAPELGRAGLVTPAVTVSLYEADGTLLTTLLVGHPTPSDSKQRFVMAKNSQRIVTAWAADLAAIPEDRASFLGAESPPDAGE